MSQPDCPREPQLVAAARAGESLGPEWAAHTAECFVCAEALAAVSLFAAGATVDVPPAGLIYWRAQLAERRQRAERAVLPMRIAENASLAALAAMAVATGVWSGAPLVAAASIAFAGLLAACGWALAHTTGHQKDSRKAN